MPRTEEAFKQIRDERRLQIMYKAAVIFAEKGLAATKINDIAEAAGISQGLLYRYFTDKEDVFVAIVERAVHIVLELAETARRQTGRPWDRLLWMTERFLHGVSKEPVFYRIFSQSLSLPGPVRERLRELRGLRATLFELICEGQAAGQVIQHDPEELALLYLCSIYGLAAAGAEFRGSSVAAHFPRAEAVMQILKP